MGQLRHGFEIDQRLRYDAEHGITPDHREGLDEFGQQVAHGEWEDPKDALEARQTAAKQAKQTGQAPAATPPGHGNQATPSTTARSPPQSPQRPHGTSQPHSHPATRSHRHPRR